MSNSKDEKRPVEKVRKAYPSEEKYESISSIAAGENTFEDQDCTKKEKYIDHLEELIKERTAELKKAREVIKLKALEHNKVEQALRGIEREQSTVLENLSDLIVYRNRDMETVWASKSMAQWHGMTQEQIVGRVCYKARYGRNEPCEDCHIIEAMKSGKRRELEKQLPDGKCWHVIVNPAFNDSREVIGTIEVSQDITERKRAEQALRMSEEKYRKLFEEGQDGIFLGDAETGILIDCNRAATEMLDREKSELIGQHQRIIHPADKIDGGFSVSFKKHLRESEGQVLEDQVITRTGQIKHVAIKANLIQIGDRKLLQAIFHDITDSKKAREELEKSKDILEKTFSSLDSAVFILDAQEPPLIMDCNLAATEIFGYEKQEMVGKTTEFLHTCRDKLLEFQEELSCSIEKNGFLSFFEFKMKRKNGTIFPSEHFVRSLRDDKGRIIGWISVVRDITERKQSEESLKDSEGKLNAMIKSLSDHMSMMDKDLNIIWANDMAKRRFGNDIIGKKCYEVYHGRNEPCEPHPCLTLKAFQDGKVHEHDTQVIDKDGNTRLFHCSANVALRAEQGKPTGVLEISRDVTDQKAVEQALRESEKSYRAVVENATEGIVVVQGGTLKFVNPALVSFVGYSKEELLSRPFIEFIHPDDRDRVMGIHTKRLKKEELPPVYEFKVIDKKGNVKWMENNGILIEWCDRPATLNFLRDVTERKKAEQALQESEEHFRTIYENALVGLYRTTPDGRILMANPALVQMLGYSSFEQLSQLNLEEEGFSQDYQRSFFKQRVEAEDRVVGLESRWMKRDGTTLYVRESARAVRDEDGKILYYEGTVVDLTERKKAEEELRIKEQKLRALLNAPTESAILVDTEGTILDINRIAAKRLGKSADSLIGKDIHEYLPPDSAEYRMARGKEAIRSGKPIRFQDEHGGHYYDSNIYPVFDDEGNVDALAIYSGDITEHRMAEEALIESEEKFRSLAEQSPNMIFINKKGRIVYANQMCEEIMGYRREELCSPDFDFRSLVTPESLDLINKNFGRHLRGEEVPPYDYSIINKEGKRIEAINTSKLIQYEGQTAILGIVTDITNRKQAERVRLAHMRFLESLDQVNRAMQGADNVDQMMSDVLDTILSVFDCDRAWLFYPCDPESSFWRVPMERTLPEYPGAHALNMEVPMDHEVAGVLRTVLDFDGPVKFGPDSEHPLPQGMARQFRFQSQISMAIHPKVGKPWMFGLHQCSHPRVWTEEDAKLLREVGRRIADAMSSMLTLCDLRESQERYRALVENANLGIALINKDYDVLMSNASQGRMIQKDHQDLIGSKCYLEFEKRNEVCPHCPGRRAMLSGRAEEAETEGVRADGTKVSVRVQASPVYGADGRVDGFVEIVEDITDRKKARQALRESEERLKILFESAPDTIYLIDSEGRFLDANRAAFELIGFTRNEVIGKSLAELGLLSAGQLSKAKDNLKRVVDGKLSDPNEYVLKRKDGTHISVEVRTFPVKIAGQMLTLGIARDISEYKRTEKKLLEHQAKLKSLASQLSLTEERERHRLATDLHDQISQSLVISKIKLDQIRKSSSSEQFNRPLEDVCNCLEQIIDDTRALTFDLSYPILYELGFEAAVAEWLTDQIQEKHGIKSEFLNDGHKKPLDDDIRVLLFRNVRELLINVVKHAQANKVKVSIRKVKNNIRVSVEDDGVGFDPIEVTTMAAKRAEFGLFSIRGRLEQLGGLIEIDSDVGRGSKITMTAPLKNKDKDEAGGV